MLQDILVVPDVEFGVDEEVKSSATNCPWVMSEFGMMSVRNLRCWE